VKIRRRLDRRSAAIVALGLLGIYLLTMGGHTYSVDGEIYLASTRSLLHHTTVMQPTSDLDGIVILIAHKNGGLTTAAPLGTLLLFAPGYVLGKVLSMPFGPASRQEVLRLVYLSANSVFTAVTAGILVLLSRALGASRKSAVLLAVAFGLGTWAWAHSQTDFSEPGTAMLLTAAIFALTRWWKQRSSRSAALVGFLIGVTVLTRSSTLLFIPIVFIAGLSQPKATGDSSRVRQACFFMAGGLIPGILFAANAWLRFGNPLDNGYPPLTYATPIYEGLFGLFLSPGKGMIWYAPVTIVVLFGLRQTWIVNRRYSAMVLALVAAHLVVYSRFEMWSGENAYGPRYLIPLLPIIISLVSPIIDTGQQWVHGVKVAALVGFLVPGILGASLYFNAVYWNASANVSANLHIESPTPTQQYLAWNFQPRSSPIALNIRALPQLARNTIARIHGHPGGITSLPAPFEDRIYWYAQAIEPDFWWAWWPTKKADAGAYLFAIIPAACFAIATRLAIRLRRQVGHDPAI
jgi:hypothetical protein